MEFINLNTDIVIKKNIVPDTTSTLDIGNTTKLINYAYVNAGNFYTLKTGGDTTAIESGYALEVVGDIFLKGSILLNTGSKRKVFLCRTPIGSSLFSFNKLSLFA